MFFHDLRSAASAVGAHWCDQSNVPLILHQMQTHQTQKRHRGRSRRRSRRRRPKITVHRPEHRPSASAGPASASRMQRAPVADDDTRSAALLLLATHKTIKKTHTGHTHNTYALRPHFPQQDAHRLFSNRWTQRRRVTTSIVAHSPRGPRRDIESSRTKSSSGRRFFTSLRGHRIKSKTVLRGRELPFACEVAAARDGELARRLGVWRWRRRCPAVTTVRSFFSPRGGVGSAAKSGIKLERELGLSLFSRFSPLLFRLSLSILLPS